MTNKQLQTIISNMDAPELQEIILSLNSKSKDAKTILDVNFGGVDVQKKFFLAVEKLEKCFKRAGEYKRSGPKIKDAKKIISDFKKFFGDRENKVLELNLEYCELLAGTLSEFGGGEESWEDSLCLVFEDCCEQVKKEQLESLYLSKLIEINRTLNQNYCELIQGTLDEYFENN